MSMQKVLNKFLQANSLIEHLFDEKQKYYWLYNIMMENIQFYSPVDFKTLPVDCQILIAHTAAMLYCLLLWQKNNASKF